MNKQTLPKILILEDDLNLLKSLTKDFSLHGYEVTALDSITNYASSSVFDFAILDVRLGQGQYGINFIESILRDSPECRIIMLTGYGSVATAVEAIKKGAINYLMKPASFKDIEKALKGDDFLKQDSSELIMPTLAQIEHEHIDYVLNKNNGNITKTAKDLGLHRQSLQRKLKKYI